MIIYGEVDNYGVPFDVYSITIGEYLKQLYVTFDGANDDFDIICERITKADGIFVRYYRHYEGEEEKLINYCDGRQHNKEFIINFTVNVIRNQTKTWDEIRELVGELPKKNLQQFLYGNDKSVT